MSSMLLALAAGLTTSLALVIPLSRLAVIAGLIDVPTDRKRHRGLVPLVGGTAIVAAILFWLPRFEPATIAGTAILALAVPALFLGMLDDRFDLSARLRLALQMLISIILVVWFDICVERLDGIFSASPIVLGGLTAAAFTVLCITGVLNATNMTDGVDGLLGTVSCLSLAIISVLAFVDGHAAEAGVAMLVAGSLVGYLLFNLGVFGVSRKVFLGDSGSMVIGLVLVVLLIALSQQAEPVFSPTAAGWLLGLPLLDTVAVMMRRMLQGRSPFSAGRDHFHHLLLDSGYSPRETLFSLCVVHVTMLSVGVTVDVSGLPSYVFFWSFVAMTIGHFFLTPRVVSYALRSRLASGEAR